MTDAEKLRQAFPEVKSLTCLEVPESSVLVVHIPKDRYTFDMGQSVGYAFKQYGIERVLIDDVGCTFSAIKQETKEEGR
jgi:hypothetical protein